MWEAQKITKIYKHKDQCLKVQNTEDILLQEFMIEGNEV